MRPGNVQKPFLLECLGELHSEAHKNERTGTVAQCAKMNRNTRCKRTRDFTTLISLIAKQRPAGYLPLMSNSIPSVAQLHRAIKIAEQIQSLESELAAILGNASAPVTKSVASSTSAPKAKRKYTKRAVVTEADGAAAADAVISGLLGKVKRKYTKKAAAAASTESPAPAKKKRKKMSAEGRAAIVAAQKVRWAKVKKEKAKLKGF